MLLCVWVCVRTVLMLLAIAWIASGAMQAMIIIEPKSYIHG